MSVPAYQLLLSEVIASSTAAKRQPMIEIPTNLLKFLMQMAVRTERFSEQAYLVAYPDIVQAIASGAFVDGHQHFLAHGYFEGRIQGAVEVDESWYRATYPDVDAAIAAGEYASSAEHFYARGVLEWRAPRADVVAELAVWKAVLAGEPLPLPTVPKTNTPKPEVLKPPVIKSAAPKPGVAKPGVAKSGARTAPEALAETSPGVIGP